MFFVFGVIGIGLMFILIHSSRVSGLKSDQRAFIETLKGQYGQFEHGPLATFEERKNTEIYRDLIREVVWDYPALIEVQDQYLQHAISEAQLLNDMLSGPNPLSYKDSVYGRQNVIIKWIEENKRKIAEVEEMYEHFEQYASATPTFVRRLDDQLQDLKLYSEPSMIIMNGFMTRYPEHNQRMSRDTATLYSFARDLENNVAVARNELLKDSLRDYYLIDEVWANLASDIKKYRDSFDAVLQQHHELDLCFQKTVVGTSMTYGARFTIVTCYGTGRSNETSHSIQGLTTTQAKELAGTKGRLLSKGEVSRFDLPNPGWYDKWFEGNSYYVSSLEPRYQVHYLTLSNSGTDRIEATAVNDADFKKFNANIGKSVMFKPKGEYAGHETSNVLQSTRELPGLDDLQKIIDARSNSGSNYRSADDYASSSFAFATTVSVPDCHKSFRYKNWVQEQEKEKRDKREREERKRKERKKKSH